MENQNEVLKAKANEILTKYGLDFTIHKAPMVALMGEDQHIPSDYFGLVNSSTGEVISTVKGGYGVSQNSEIVEMVLKAIEPFGTKLSVSKAGSLNGGRRVYMQLAIEGDSYVGDDIIKRYITIIDSNDRSYSLSVGIGDVTMSCMNQFARFYAKGDKVRHCASIEQKMRELPVRIVAALEKSMMQIDLYKKLADTSIEGYDIVNHLVKLVLGFDRVYTSTEVLARKTQRSIDKMNMLYSHIDEELLGKGMNLWGLHSGVTSYTTHELKAPQRANGDYESLLMGKAYDLNQKSLRFVTDEMNKRING